MWNKAKAILLASNQETNSLYGYKDKSLLFNYNKDFYNKLEVEKEFTQHFHLYIINDDVIKEGDKVYHPKLGIGEAKVEYETLCFYIPRDEITGKGSLTTPLERNVPDCKKIIATTDKLILKISKSINKEQFPNIILPQIPQSFIEQYITEYNQGNIISDVLVEYDEILGDEAIIAVAFKESDFKLKINQSNEINIKTIKDSFSRDELIAFVKQAVIDCERDELDCHVNGDYQNLNKYILENL